MKRLFSIIFLIFPIFTLKGMDSTGQFQKSIFDRIPVKVAGYLYGLPEFFSVKHQLATYGIQTEGGNGYKQLDQPFYDEVVALLEETNIDASSICIMQLNATIQDTPGFVVTNGGVFIDQAWWSSLSAQESCSEHDIKKFFMAVMAEQLKNGQYRKHLATKIVVDGVLVSFVIGVVTYTVAPSVCSWVAETVPGTSWLDAMSTGIAQTANQTCDQFYSPALCMYAGKTVWSSLLTPGVAPYMHALVTAPVARYLAQQAHNKALASIVNKQAIVEYCKQMNNEEVIEHEDQLPKEE